MAGIVPTSPGYSTVEIKPAVSPRVGPSSVEAVVHTVRGPVVSNWTRHTQTHKRKAQIVLSMRIQIPAGIQHATVRVPLLGHEAKQAEVKLQQLSTLTEITSTATIWRGIAIQNADTLSCEAVVGADGNDALELAVGTGLFNILVFSL